MRLDVYGDGTKIVEIARPAVIVASLNGEPVLLNYGEYDVMNSYLGNYSGASKDSFIEPKVVEIVDINDFQAIISDKNRFNEYFIVI